MNTYTWRTDAAHGEIEAATVDAALTGIIEQNEWAAIDSGRETREINDGAFLIIWDADQIPVITRGECP